ncbi:DUF934 domain-containing protein [Sandaracinobacteroides saxicola]|uniref:DUF934 domain-containing protein n=1 Tax=Sandaracinobacteroides saxicola TaxID=2759707 RepID=A0A7G5IHH6_9SPHN|nr:DUF934 domain-containing protein [Sandaracinobacteroides saxicola]QMW22818.1 DUF934 domain-containing protein [Sandaracinobacteroides saxicola]
MVERSGAEWLALDPRAREVADAPLVNPGDDVRGMQGLHQADAIFIAFPTFRDGRGYSSARLLREAGFDGDIRAVGDVTLDQLVFLKRSGFSSVAPDRPIDPADAHRTLNRFKAVYQRAADDAEPVWAARG